MAIKGGGPRSLRSLGPQESQATRSYHPHCSSYLVELSLPGVVGLRRLLLHAVVTRGDCGRRGLVVRLLLMVVLSLMLLLVVVHLLRMQLLVLVKWLLMLLHLLLLMQLHLLMMMRVWLRVYVLCRPKSMDI